MEMKVCSRIDCLFAGQPQPLDRFYKNKTKKNGESRCKLCANQHHKQYIEIHEKNLQEYHREYYRQDKDFFIQKSRTYYQDHKEQQMQRCKDYKRERMKVDLNYKIVNYLRTRLYCALKGNFKSGSAISDLMISINDFKLYLEERFYPNPKTGEVMSWKNYGRKGWHIDHVKPLALFNLTDSQQFKQAVHYTNLQPMWAEENLSKGIRYENQAQ